MNNMNKILTQLEKIKKSGKMGLMTHVIIGFPTIAETKELIQALADGGSDFIELQIPFSDPIADGPVIMKASDIALKNGTTVQDGMEMMREMSSKVSVPLLFMSYYNSIYNYGVEQFCKDASKAGASGLIVPDVPPEEEPYEHFIEICKKYGLILVRVISPASSVERLEKNAQSAEGFVYCVSRFGVTGTSSELDSRLTDYLKKVQGVFNLPRAVGFGISTPEQVNALESNAEIAVVGSAIVEKVLAKESLSVISKFITLLTSK
jgi:tryptophan synthase alpha subunit